MWSSSAVGWLYRLPDNTRNWGRSEEHWFIFRWFFGLLPLFFWPPSLALVAKSPIEGWGAITWCGWDKLLKRSTITDIKTLVPCIRAKGCMLDICAFVIWLVVTTPIWTKKKVTTVFYPLLKYSLQIALVLLGLAVMASALPTDIVDFETDKQEQEQEVG